MKQEKLRKQQDDRLLKRLSLAERRQQEQLRKMIKSEAMFQAA